MATKPRITRTKSEHIVKKSKRKRTEKLKLKRANTVSLHETRSGLPRKLGPRDVGRIKYKGTKFTGTDETKNSSFLDEKIYEKCKSKSFQQRKSKNPISKKETVAEIGRTKGWHSIDFQMNNDENNESFLNEKLYFEGSRVSLTSGLSQIMEALPADKKMEMNALKLPTGIHSKREFIKKLNNIASNAFVLKPKKSENVDLRDPFENVNGNDENIDMTNALKSLNISNKTVDVVEREKEKETPGVASGDSVMLWSTRNN